MRSVALATSVMLMWLGGPARAAEPTEGEPGGLDHAVSTVAPAFEIAIAGGYSQGTGEIGDNMNHMQDLSGPGGGGELKLGYRPMAPLAFGVFGGCSPLGSPDMGIMSGSSTSTTATAGVFADWHFRADRSLDPWVGLSTGWRGFWIVPQEGETMSMQGLEIARLQVGLDFRLTPEIAIAPVIGASVAAFLTRKEPGMSGFEDIAAPKPSFFFFAGLQARFDVFGTRTRAGRPLASLR